jgi:hypothetical protein
MIRLTYAGKTLIISDWSKLTGLPERTIANRIGSGWTTERALTEPVSLSQIKGPVSKNDAELALNDMTFDQLPPQLAQLIKNPNAKKHGRNLRDNFRKEFDLWFKNTYSGTAKH